MTQQIKTFQLDIDTELLLNADPSDPLGSATKQYVDGAVSAVSGLNIAITSQSSNYIAYNNGVIEYSVNIPSLSPGQTVVITLPIANNEAEFWLDGFHGSNILSGIIDITNLTQTAVTFTNVSGLTISAQSNVRFVVI